MLISASLPKVFWAEAIMSAAYLINRCPSTTLEMKTPEEVWFGRPTDYSRLKVFGCTTYAHIKHNKLEPRALRCVLIGYPEGVKDYRLWCLELGHRRCIISRDVVFKEHEMGYSKKPDETQIVEPVQTESVVEVEQCETSGSGNEVITVETVEDQTVEIVGD